MSADYGERRVKMVDGQLRTTDVTSIPVLNAFLAVPREAFVPTRKKSLAYIDEHVDVTPSGSPVRRFLMEASPLAKLIQLAGIGPDDVVLDVGSATGYSAAILSRICGSVIALESDPALAEQASNTLTELGYDNVAVVQGGLSEGYPSEAPYDVILFGGSVEQIPQNYFDQLKQGGRLVVVEGTGNSGVAQLYIRDAGTVSARRGFNAAVRPLPGFERASAFEF